MVQYSNIRVVSYGDDLVPEGLLHIHYKVCGMFLKSVMALSSRALCNNGDTLVILFGWKIAKLQKCCINQIFHIHETVSYHNQTSLVAVCVARRFGRQGQVRKLSGIVWGARIVTRCVGNKFIAHCSMLIDQAGGRSIYQTSPNPKEQTHMQRQSHF